MAYSERASGDEVHVERATPLAAVYLGPQRLPTVVIERTGADWVTYAFLAVALAVVVAVAVRGAAEVPAGRTRPRRA